MKSIIITSACIVAGAHADPGTFLTVEKAEAILVVGCGRARYATEEEIANASKTAPAAPVELAAEPAREAASAAPGGNSAAEPAATSRRRRG